MCLNKRQMQSARPFGDKMGKKRKSCFGESGYIIIQRAVIQIILGKTFFLSGFDFLIINKSWLDNCQGPLHL
jgi:hypothetical protein